MSGTDFEEAIDVLKHFRDNNLYGSVEVKFQAGRVVLVRKVTTHIPASNQRTWDARGKDENAAHNSR